MRRKIEDEFEAKAVLAAAAAAGVSPGEWAREHGVHGRSLDAWRGRLSRGVQRSGLVELVPSTTSSSRRVVVRVGDAEVELDGDFDEATLAGVVRALRSC
jgi:transposase-like protein